jgi:hypothetical protein
VFFGRGGSIGHHEGAFGQTSADQYPFNPRIHASFEVIVDDDPYVRSLQYISVAFVEMPPW